ncbi:sugar phosphate isomerase/epimerase family protein [Neolewinella persica]|uniref:sugar phosphate isomerase/epimerase family protein n=1 Tax=Neolewinella persica TaxID=70998 RepID=UPI00037FF114|nr:sugar phosphate isomerase/epimerase [Neolewinella persica]
MLTNSRRIFLRNSIIAAAGLPLLGCGNTTNKTTTKKTPEEMPESTLPYLDTIGIQLWTVRDQMEKDPHGTLKTLKELGYYQVEFGDTRLLGELKPVCDDLGLKVHSSFINWNTVTGGWQYTPDDTPFEFNEVLDQAGEAGLSHLVFGYLRPEERTSGDDWRKLADDLNEAGLRAKQSGLQMAYHNHNFEWDPIEGTTGFDLLLDRMDGDLVPFELDLFWAQIAGQDARKTMERISNRLELLHLKQLHPGTPVVTRLDDVPGNAYEELPDGEMPIKELMRYGKELGVAYCMVEQDGNYDTGSLASAEKSLIFLQG